MLVGLLFSATQSSAGQLSHDYLSPMGDHRSKRWKILVTLEWKMGVRKWSAVKDICLRLIFREIREICFLFCFILLYYECFILLYLMKHLLGLWYLQNAISSKDMDTQYKERILLYSPKRKISWLLSLQSPIKSWKGPCFTYIHFWCRLKYKPW